MIVVEGQLAHRVVPPIERPESKTGSAGRGGNQRVSDLEPVRARVTRQIGAGAPSHCGVEHDLPPSMEERVRDRLFA